MLQTNLNTPDFNTTIIMEMFPCGCKNKKTKTTAKSTAVKAKTTKKK